MSNGRERVGPEWTGAITTLSLVITLSVVTAALYLAQMIFIPIALAVVGTFILTPAVSRLQRWGVGRKVAVIVTIFFAGATVAAVAVVVGQQLSTLGNTLSDHRPNILAKINQAKTILLGTEKSRLSQLGDDVAEVFLTESKSRSKKAETTTIWGVPVKSGQEPQRVIVEEQATSWYDSVLTMGGPVGAVVGTMALTFVLIVFMLLRREDLRNRMIRLIGDGRVTITTKAVDDAGQRISRYLLTQLALNACFGLVIVVGLLFIGVEYAALWGFIAFLMRYVPYIGTWIGVVPPLLFTLAVSPGWSETFIVFSLFIGLEMICNNIFEPMLYGSSLGISEVAQLVAAAFWAFLWGPIGLILSGPLTVCLLILGKYVRRLEFLEILLGDEPALTPRMAFYQRLVARDQDEAANIALDYKKQNQTASVFDDVVFPALALAKRDHQAGLLSEENWNQAIRTAREVVDDIASFDLKNLDASEVPDKPLEPSVRLPILLMPVHDDADLTATEILVQRIDVTRWSPEILPLGTLASELAAKVRMVNPAVVVLISLLPKGVSHSRYLVNRIRSADAKVNVLIGRWGFSEDLDDSTPAAGIEGVDRWSDSLQVTLQQLQELAPVLRDKLEASTSERGRSNSKVSAPLTTALSS